MLGGVTVKVVIFWLNYLCLSDAELNLVGSRRTWSKLTQHIN